MLTESISARNPYHLLCGKEDELNELLAGAALLDDANVKHHDCGERGVSQRGGKRGDDTLPSKQPKNVPVTISYIFLEDDDGYDGTVSGKARLQQQLLQMKATRVKIPGPGPTENTSVKVRHIILDDGGHVEEIISDSGQVRQMLRYKLAQVDPMNRKEFPNQYAGNYQCEK
ncbi:hypothetical protein R1sor_010193 [Riccia sorocarpa]|uniref:Uncharacterized protein n=1 Tax=Riccia sorocarpa TaxID=122646 RepID=A0ABD3I0Y3_9MARC